MRAARYTRYGPAGVVQIEDMSKPEPGPDQILIRVSTSSLTTADWRLRASAFPGILWLPGRLMTGLFAPRHQVLGTDAAGVVEAVGAQVTRFVPGQRVFGHLGHGGHAEFAVVAQDGAVVETPDSLTDAEAAALPFGGLAALVFLRDVARLQPGQHVLIVGASGGVGAYAVQIAKALGAEITAVAGAGREPLLRQLGADHVIDYTQSDLKGQLAAMQVSYDLVFDTVGVTHWADMRPWLKPDGAFLPLNFGARELVHLLQQKLFGGPRLVLHVNEDQAEDLRTLTDMIAKQTLRPLIDSEFALESVVAAHKHVESRHRSGAVIIRVADPHQPCRRDPR